MGFGTNATLLGVAVGAAAFMSSLVFAPPTMAGPAGIDNEVDYLVDLDDAGVNISALGTEEEVVKIGYLLCVIKQLNGETPDGLGTVMKYANRNLCDYMPPLPASQQSSSANQQAILDAHRSLPDQNARTLFGDEDGTGGNDDDLDGRTNAGDRAQYDDAYQ